MEIEIPDYPWSIIKEFLFRKIHPTSKILKTWCDRYQRPQIFMSRYFKLKNGSFVLMEKAVLQIELESNLKFIHFIIIKQLNLSNKYFMARIKKNCL
jgi:hypothetical protein